MADVWATIDLGSIFPNREAEFTAASNLASAAKQEADTVVLRFSEKGQAASQTLSVTSNLLTQITKTGYNTLFMPPDQKDFFERLNESEGKPFPDDWTAGICIFIQGPSITETAEKYAALLDILNS